MNFAEARVKVLVDLSRAVLSRDTHPARRPGRSKDACVESINWSRARSLTRPGSLSAARREETARHVDK